MKTKCLSCGFVLAEICRDCSEKESYDDIRKSKYDMLQHMINDLQKVQALLKSK